MKNAVFDMGQVLIRFDREAFIRRLDLPEEDGRRMMEHVFLGPEWTQMDRGALTEAQALASVCARLPARLRGPAEELIFRWDRPILPVEGMHGLLKELKRAGCGLYLLSNASLRQREYWPRIPGWELFDGAVISAEERCVKPEERIYRILLERYGLAAETCFFVDDVPENVQGARRCGMDGWVFDGSVDRLRERLGRAGFPVGDREETLC